MVIREELAVTEFEAFKWNTLGDAVFEDYQGLWEPLWRLRGGGIIEGQSEPDRQTSAERALRELYADGLIYFFRVPPPHDINESAETPALRLTPREVDETLSQRLVAGTRRTTRRSSQHLVRADSRGRVRVRESATTHS